MTDLPFATRNAVELLVDAPGTSTPTKPRSSSINGLPKGAINVTIDGMNTQDNMLKSSDGFFSYIMPSVDSLEEVTLSTSAGGVDSTSQGGAQIKFVTRSGTNQFHGGGFYQVRNTSFNANYYFNNQQAGLPRDIIKLHQDGGHIGGPIKKDKLFFFGNVEALTNPGTNLTPALYLTPRRNSGNYTYATARRHHQQVNCYNSPRRPTPACRPASGLSHDARSAFGQDLRAHAASRAPSGIVRTNQSARATTTPDTPATSPTAPDSRDFYHHRAWITTSPEAQLSLVYNYD